MKEQWQELKETIIEMRDNNGTGTQEDVCKYLVDYMGVLEKQIQEPKTGRWIQAKRPFNFRFKCSECGIPALKNERNGNDVKSKYCPRCGAKMESEG